MGANRPLTFGPDEIGRLKEIVLAGEGKPRPGGAYTRVAGHARALSRRSSTKGHKLSRPIRVRGRLRQRHGGRVRAASACGASAPTWCRWIASSTTTFPNYNPNPEDLKMLHAHRRGGAGERRRTRARPSTATATAAAWSTIEGHEIFADKVGVLLGARSVGAAHKNAKFVVDVKSTGIFMTDPVLKEQRRRRPITGRPDIPTSSGAPHELGRARRLREERPLFLQSADRPRLRRRHRRGDRHSGNARPRRQRDDLGAGEASCPRPGARPRWRPTAPTTRNMPSSMR